MSDSPCGLDAEKTERPQALGELVLACIAMVDGRRGEAIALLDSVIVASENAHFMFHGAIAQRYNGKLIGSAVGFAQHTKAVNEIATLMARDVLSRPIC